MMGVFVQLNGESTNPMSQRHPVGYVIQENGCWEWVGALDGRGYGTMWAGGKMCKAHRVMYERTRGTIPDGFDIDHLCRTPECVNPSHMEAVTHRVNLLRGVGVSARNRAKTHCRHGHPLSDGNLIACLARRGKRLCRTCNNARQRKAAQ